MGANARALVRAYYEALWGADSTAAMERGLTVDYREHQYTAGFSREGLLDYVTRRRAEHPAHAVIVHHMLSEGDFVFLLAEEKLGGGVDVARAELFRLERDRIAEHWGSHVLDEKNRKNANGTFDGPQVDRDTDYAERFADAFEALDERGFNRQELETFAISRTPDYRQHSPKGGDGLTGLVEILSRLKAGGGKMTMDRKRTLRDGDFVMSHRLYDSDPKHPLINRINTFDMFRLDAQGRAVEHWDVMEDVPSEDMLEQMF